MQVSIQNSEQYILLVCLFVTHKQHGPNYDGLLLLALSFDCKNYMVQKNKHIAVEIVDNGIVYRVKL